jgi:hypothetical protein
MVKIEKSICKIGGVLKSCVTVESPYNPEFSSRARGLGGKWKAPLWIFDERDEKRVKELCVEIYGTDGVDSDLVSIRVTLEEDDWNYELSFYVAGRQVARAFDRDSGARLGEGVILLNGKFGSSGSRKSPAITVDKGTVFELRDIPRKAILNTPGDRWRVEIIDENVDVSALREELIKIEARAAEIRKIIGE